MRVLLTGANGFIGSHLLPQLMQAGHDVRALVRRPPPATPNRTPNRDSHFETPNRDSHFESEKRDSHSGEHFESPNRDSHLTGKRDSHSGEQEKQEREEKRDSHSAENSEAEKLGHSPATCPLGTCEFVVGTLPEASLSALLCRDIDAVIHAAGLAHVNASAADLHRANFEASVELATAARAAGVRRFLFLSSSKAAWPDHSVYGAGKAATENALLALQVPGVFTVHCLRPALVYGAGMRGNLAALLRLLKRPQLPLFVHSSNPLGMISVNDLCRALQVALVAPELPGGVHDLSDGESYTLDQIVYHVRALLGLPPPRIHVPAVLLRLVAVLAGLLAPLYRTSFSMSTWYTLFAEHYRHDPAFTRLTGFEPQDSLLAQLPQLLKEESAT